MAHPDDYSDDYPPWGKRARLVPLRTYSGRVVYPHKKHKFTAADAARIVRALEPPENTNDGWFDRVIQVLQDATVAMLEKLLPFLSPIETRGLYDYVFAIIERWFVSVGLSDENIRRWARGLIVRIAELSGVTVTIKEG